MCIRDRVAADNEIVIEHMEVMPDHVHVLISFPPSKAPVSYTHLFRTIEKLGMLFGRFTPLAFPNFIERVITGGIEPIVNTRGKKLR